MDTEDRSSFIAGLCAIARFLDEHPEVPLPYLGPGAEGSDLPCLPIYLVAGDQKAQIATITRAMGNAVKAPKSYGNGDERFQVWREFEGIVLMAQASRDQVCTRVVTGTEDREVEEIVTPAVKRTVVKPVEVIEWRCEPLLATAAEMTEAALEHDPAGVADAVIAALRPAPVPHDLPSCGDCGSVDVPLNADGVCWNKASCAARVALAMAPRASV